MSFLTTPLGSLIATLGSSLIGGLIGKKPTPKVPPPLPKAAPAAPIKVSDTTAAERAALVSRSRRGSTSGLNLGMLGGGVSGGTVSRPTLLGG